MDICLSSWLFLVTMVTVTTPKCLHHNNNPDPAKRKLLLDHPLTIESSDRISHQVTNHILKILLEDVLGYSEVELVNTGNNVNITDTLQILSRCNLDLESERQCIPKAMVNLETWTPLGFSAKPWENSDGISDAGLLGPYARFGWYLPKFTIDKFLRAECATFADHWRALHVNSLTKELNAVTRELRVSCRQVARLKELTSGENRSYCSDRECRDGIVHGANCSLCDQCAMLVSSYPEMDQGAIKKQIQSLGLNVSVAWIGPNLNQYVQSRTAMEQPTVFFNWVPNTLTSSQNYSRIPFPDCDLGSSESCDFSWHQLKKFVWSKLQLEAPEAYHVISHLSFTHEYYQDLLRNFTSHDTPETFACNWLKKNEKLWSHWIPSNKTTIYLGGLFPQSGFYWRQPGIEPGARMAIDFVNQNSSVLQDFKLELIVDDSECSKDVVLRTFIQYLSNTTHKFAGVLGPGCSDTAEPIAGVAKHYNWVIISYGVESVTLSDREKYPYFFRTIPQISQYAMVFIELFKKMGWFRVGTLVEDGSEYPVYHVILQEQFRDKIEIVSKNKIPRNIDLDASTYLKDFQQKHVRVIIGDFYETSARAILCQAFKMDMTAYDGYVWFLPGWYTFDWYDTDYYNGEPFPWERRLKESVPCTTKQMLRAIEGHFSFMPAFYDELDQVVIGNVTVRKWKENYNNIIKDMQNKTNQRDITGSKFATYAYDAVWVYALALDKLLSKEPAAINSLHSRITTDKFMKHLDDTKFSGVSGHVSFNGTDRSGIVHIKQYCNETYSNVGSYQPSNGKGRELSIEKDLIRWLSGERPGDGSKELCSVEPFRAFLGVECDAAIAIANVIGVGFFIIIIVVLLVIIKRSYDIKVQRTRDRMEELGLLSDYNWLTLDEWEMQRDRVVLNRKLGQGAFGMVYGGEALFNEQWEAVAVKTLKIGSAAEEKLEFLSEAETMKRFEHKNVVKLLGVCTRGEPAYAVMEFMLHGDLKTFLLSRRQLVGQNLQEAGEVSPAVLTRMALDVANGLQYLHEMAYVHRDVACRNCLVHANKAVKLADFGMARPVFDNGYYRFSKRGMLPVRWMAPESLTDGLFTPLSDMWSFGVLLYEIVTFGSFPYQGLSNNQVLDYVRCGNTLKISNDCNEDLRELMLSCWSFNAEDRPSGLQVVDILNQNHDLVEPFLEGPLAAVITADNACLEVPRPNKQKRFNHPPSRKMLSSVASNSSIFSHQDKSPGPLNTSFNMQEIKSLLNKGNEVPELDFEAADQVLSIPSLHSSQESICPTVLECAPVSSKKTLKLNKDNLINIKNSTFMRSISSSSVSPPHSPTHMKHIKIPQSVEEKGDSDYCSDYSKEYMQTNLEANHVHVSVV